MALNLLKLFKKEPHYYHYVKHLGNLMELAEWCEENMKDSSVKVVVGWADRSTETMHHLIFKSKKEAFQFMLVHGGEYRYIDYDIGAAHVTRPKSGLTVTE